MPIQSLLELREFLAWCRANGVQAVEVGSIKAAFAPIPQVHRVHERDTASTPVDPRTGYTEEELFGSAD